MTTVTVREYAPGAMPTPGLDFGEKTRGAVFTKQSVVDFMLDLIGYTTDLQLAERTLLEPSFGGGRFVLSAVDRLIESWRSHGGVDPADLAGAIRAGEIDEPTFVSFRGALLERLVAGGFDTATAVDLADTWLFRGDFLTSELYRRFDFVIGNPPYVRQELIEDALLNRYRSEFPTMIGRADLYVAFMERSLNLLKPGGRLSFICADAWVKNDYGRGIRAKIAGGYRLRHYVDMYGLDAFEVRVGAYPSITVIERGESGTTWVAKAESVDSDYLGRLASDLASPTGPSKNAVVVELEAVRGAQPWLLSTTLDLAVIRDLESRYPTVVQAGCRVGIGVATGADRVFIAPYDELDVEEDRKLPLATNRCAPKGRLQWTGKGVVNPFSDDGTLVDLDEYPRLRAYLAPHKDQLGKRHTARKNVERRWYKTIDRITPSLLSEPKLLIPDIKGDADGIAFDPGSLYPHHNLYFITSSEWNLRALQSVLRSGIAELFVAAYSVKVGGGYLRFQAQNLKRIRVPMWADIAKEDQEVMVAAGEVGTRLSTELLERIYGMAEGDLAFLGESAAES